MANTFYTLGPPAKSDKPPMKRSLVLDIIVAIFTVLCTLVVVVAIPAGMTRSTFSALPILIWMVAALGAVCGLFYLLPLVARLMDASKPYIPVLVATAAFAFLATLLVT